MNADNQASAAPQGIEPRVRATATRVTREGLFWALLYAALLFGLWWRVYNPHQYLIQEEHTCADDEQPDQPTWAASPACQPQE